MTRPTIRTTQTPDGHVLVELDRDGRRVAVELGWRTALGLSMRMGSAARACASQEGLTDAEFDVLFDAMGDQVIAEIEASL